jgi:hypothetical protein
MRDLEELMFRRARIPSTDAVLATEQAIGQHFPEAYKALVARYGGASPEVGVFSYEDEESAISEFLDIEPLDGLHSVARYVGRSIGGIPAGIVPFARDANDCLICFDYRLSPSQPRVVVFDPHDRSTKFVAESFEEFLDMLHE